MQSPELLSMIEKCPPGAEPLVARIVHLLTERNVPSKELVEKVCLKLIQRLKICLGPSIASRTPNRCSFFAANCGWVESRRIA